MSNQKNLCGFTESEILTLEQIDEQKYIAAMSEIRSKKFQENLRSAVEEAFNGTDALLANYYYSGANGS